MVALAKNYHGGVTLLTLSLLIYFCPIIIIIATTLYSFLLAPRQSKYRDNHLSVIFILIQHLFYILQYGVLNLSQVKE